MQCSTRILAQEAVEFLSDAAMQRHPGSSLIDDNNREIAVKERSQIVKECMCVIVDIRTAPTSLRPPFPYRLSFPLQRLENAGFYMHSVQDTATTPSNIVAKSNHVLDSFS